MFYKKLTKDLTNYGFTLNKSKNKICLSNNGIDPRPFLPKPVVTRLNRAIKQYTNGNVNLGGLKVLGIPLGSSSFIQQELADFEKNLANDTFELL